MKAAPRSVPILQAGVGSVEDLRLTTTERWGFGSQLFLMLLAWHGN